MSPALQLAFGPRFRLQHLTRAQLSNFSIASNDFRISYGNHLRSSTSSNSRRSRSLSTHASLLSLFTLTERVADRLRRILMALLPSGQVEEGGVSPHQPWSLRSRRAVWEKLRPLLEREFAGSTTSCSSGHVASFFEVASGTGAHVELFSYLCPSVIFQQSELDAETAGKIVEIDHTSPDSDSSGPDTPERNAVAENTRARLAATGELLGEKASSATGETGAPSAGASPEPVLTSRRANNILPPVVIDLLNVAECYEESVKGANRGNTNQGNTYQAKKPFLPTCDILYACNVCHISPWGATEGLFRDLAVRMLQLGASEDLSIAAPERKRFLVIYGPFKRHGEFTTESNANFDKDLKGRNPLWGYRDVEELEKLGTEVGLQLWDVHEMPANNFLLLFCTGRK